MKRSCLTLLACVLAAGCGGATSREAGKDVTLGGTGPASPAKRERPVPRRPTGISPRPSPSKALEASRPPIVNRPIPFDGKRIEETATYSRRHYGQRETRLDPKVIVEHFTVTPTVDRVISLFSEDKPDVELHELPGVCSHFLIGRDGTIYQLVPIRLICRHTVGLNDVAIGIEHVGAGDDEVLGNRVQLSASLRLTAWLRCSHGIELGDVIGHAESLSSPYHHEQVAALKTQTHDDFKRAAMERYRGMLRRRSCQG